MLLALIHFISKQSIQIIQYITHSNCCVEYSVCMHGGWGMSKQSSQPVNTKYDIQCIIGYAIKVM